MSFTTYQNCLVCGDTRLKELSPDYQHAYLVRCGNCGHVFCNRVPTEEELAKHYGGYPQNTPLSPVTQKRYQELLDQFEPFRKNNRMLDVGCGDGHFLNEAKLRGWEVYGTEFTASAVAICEAKGIRMFQGRIQDLHNSTEFDVITSFEVLEHINDGKEHVAKIYSLLRKGGLFYFTTPNFNSFSRRWLGGKWNIIEYPEHLVYYTPSTLHHLLTVTGFSKDKLFTTGISVQRFRQSQSGSRSAQPGRDEELRQNIESSTMLSLMKRMINSLLILFNWGDTIKGFYRK